MSVSRGTLRKGGGRPKGARNKLPGQIKELVEGALADVGGRDYLVKQARKNPKAFLGLVAKLIPRDLNVSGEVRHTLVELIAASNRQRPEQSSPQIEQHEQPSGSGLPN